LQIQYKSQILLFDLTRVLRFSWIEPKGMPSLRWPYSKSPTFAGEPYPGNSE
jgi:hypothetical protein